MKSARIYFSNLFFWISLILITSGCYKKKFDKLSLANAQPEYLYPLIDAELNLKNIVDPSKKQLNITENSGGYYTFIYYEDVFDKYMTDYLKISDKTFNQSVSLTTGEVVTLPGAGSVTHNFSGNYTLAATNQEQLNTVLVKSGSIPLTVSSTFKHNIELTITFPFIKKNGTALSQLVRIANNGSAFSQQIDLSGYSIDLSKGGTVATGNTISFNGMLKVTFVSGNPITTGQKIDITTGLQDILYSYADGYIGKYTLEIPEDTLAIDLFTSAYAGNVFFTDPKVRAIVYNSIGVPATVKINSLAAISNMTGYVLITGTEINKDIPIAFPASKNDKGQNTTIQLDKNNSNIQTIFNPAPDEVIYKMSGDINKAGNTNIFNFVTDTSRIKVRGEVEIPMEGNIKQLVLLDTIKGITYPEIDIGNDVTVLSAAFIVNLMNGFPADAFLQMYFLNDTDGVIDSLFSKGPQLLLSGKINSEGEVIQPTNTFFKEIFDEKRYANITESKNAVLYIFLRTANNGNDPVRIYPSYKIKSNIAIDIKANVSF